MLCMNNIEVRRTDNRTRQSGKPLLLITHRYLEQRRQKRLPVDDIELPELAGKIISSAKITRPSVHEQEVALEFSDGTSFSFCCSSKVTSEVSVYRGGVGEPEVIRDLAVE